MSDVCSFCRNTDFDEKSVDHVYRRGEQYYEADVLVTIESDFEAIENGTREAEKRLSVPVEDFSRLVG